MVSCHAPPTRTSIATEDSGISFCGPPNQSANRSGSVHSFHTRSRGASNTRTSVKPSVTQPCLQGVEAVVPEATVLQQPLDGLPHPLALHPRRAELRPAAAGDEARLLQHLEVH